MAPVTWCHTTSMPRSPRRLAGLPRAQRLPVDRVVHAGRAAFASCGTSERRAVSATSSIVVRTRPPCAPDGSQEVSGASTVVSPAVHTCSTMSALPARASAAARGGGSSMWQLWCWRHLVDCSDRGRTATWQAVIHTTSAATAVNRSRKSKIRARHTMLLDQGNTP